ncbi:peptidase M20 [Cellulomonas marina]|uniref:M20/M25/M40 family metallo-hydrolase n=1 Tax=Cellulomonas marina TaxID=988821 RepID=UPI000B7F3578|nr:M20/M25/M40 family metallo-hydrolase [Cellulomonas marina]GIG28222.1 peptidase M20 [Cellulomonas marina]
MTDDGTASDRPLERPGDRPGEGPAGGPAHGASGGSPGGLPGPRPPARGAVAAVDAGVLARADEAVALLRALVHLESPTGDATAVGEVVALLTATAATLPGARCRTVPSAGGPHLVVDVPGHGAAGALPPVLLVGHADTVWPVGTLDGDVPWREEGDVLAGPGAFDMKSGLVVALTALAVLAEAGLDRRPARLVVVADEEVGSSTGAAVVTEAAEGCAAVLGFEAPHADGALKDARLGSTRVRLVVTGREAHAAVDPEKGVNAVDELVDQLLAVRQRLAAVATEHPGTLLVNAGGVSGGGRANVVPARAEALLGLRFGDADVEREVLGYLEALVPVREGATVAAEVLSHRPTWAPGAASAGLLAAVRAAGAAVGVAVEARPAPGAADTNGTGALGLPTLDGLGPAGGGAHAVTEHLRVTSLLDRVRLVAVLLHTL